MTESRRVRRSSTGFAAFLLLGCASIAAGCSGGSADAGNGAVYDAWRAQHSRIEVTASGSVSRILGTRLGRSGAHEGFLLHLSGADGHGLTVRVEDNVDLTGPIPLAPGEAATVRGEYIYDPRGGLIHYTHRDPRGYHAAGYVQAAGRVYQ
ncbi:MAG: DUF3465 domain-containing protein [Candidatus Eremiobacteraeota bacterium]|nr:DUF3465 domain-containing protein [Candidatus Eremiobacteraeota bacterium]